MLISSIIGDGTDNCFLYEPGDKVKVSTVTDQSEMEEIKTENRETVGVEYTNMEEKSMRLWPLWRRLPAWMNTGMRSMGFR